MLAFLLGFLPFTNFFRAFPIPSMWMELSAAVLFSLWVCLWPKNRSGSSADPQYSGIGYAGACCLLLMLAIAFQSALLEVGGGAFYAVAALMLALLVGLRAMHVDGGMSSSRESFFVNWSAGLLAAFFLNAAATLLAFAGLELVLLTLVEARPLVRAGGMFGQPNQFAVFCVLCLSVTRFLLLRGKLSLWAVFFVQACAAALIAMTASRAGLLAWLLAALFWLVWSRRHKYSAGSIYSEAFFVLTAQLLYFLFLARGGDHLSNASLVSAASIGPRMEQLRDAVILAIAHPWVGVGWGGFASSRFFELNGSLGEPQSAHTHNLFTQLIVELGVFGWIASLCILILVVRASCRALKHADAAMCAGSVCVSVIFLYAMFEYPLWYFNFLLTFSTLLGFCGPRDVLFRVRLNFVVLRSFGVLAFVVSGLFLYDYVKMQRDIFSAGAHVFGGEVKEVGEADVLRYRMLTLYPDIVDSYWISVTSHRDGAASLKFPLVERSFSAVPSGGAGAQYILYAIAVGDWEKARIVYLRFQSGSPDHFKRMRRVLDYHSGGDSELKLFLSAMDNG